MKNYSLALFLVLAAVLIPGLAWANQATCNVPANSFAIEQILFNEADFPWVTATTTAYDYQNPPPTSCSCDFCCIDYLCWREVLDPWNPWGLPTGIRLEFCDPEGAGL